MATGLLVGCDNSQPKSSAYDAADAYAAPTHPPEPAPAAPSPPDPNGWFVGLAGDGECVRLTDLGSASTPEGFADNLRGAGVELALIATDDPNIVSLRTYAPRTASYVLARPKDVCDSTLVFMALASQ